VMVVQNAFRATPRTALRMQGRWKETVRDTRPESGSFLQSYPRGVALFPLRLSPARGIV